MEVFIVLLEPIGELIEDALCGADVSEVDEVPLEGLDEGFGDAVRLR